MDNLMEWNGLFSAKNIRVGIYRDGFRPMRYEVANTDIFTKFIFTINIKRHSVYRLYVCDIFIVNHKFTL